jgi:hypothetical protein
MDAVAYLGHTISAAGVAMDPAKVQAIHDWPQPHSVRAVWGFLGLVGHYSSSTTTAPSLLLSQLF